MQSFKKRNFFEWKRYFSTQLEKDKIGYIAFSTQLTEERSLLGS
jgi:hypothetical protein